MMRLKDILKESNSDIKSSDDLEELEEELASGKWYMEEELIYRGETFRDTSTWKVRKIRKNRKPKDTPPYIQAIVDGMAANFETDYPLRSESKFGGGSYRKGELKGYGDLKVCFPQKSASVFNRHHDTYTLFQTLSTKAKSIKASDKDKIDKERYPHIYKFLKYLESPHDKREKIFQLLTKHYSEIFDSCVNLVEKNTLITFEYMYDFLDEIQEGYFGELEKGVSSHSYEHIFDGEKYLVVDAEIFERGFHFEDGLWKLKNGV